MKNFVKAMDRNDTSFLYLRQKFPLPSDVKIPPAQTFTHFFVMRYLKASLQVTSREHGMPSERWLQASYEIEE